jgi:twitching motility protein PilI
MYQANNPPQVPGASPDYSHLTLDIAALSKNKKINRYGFVVGSMGFLVPENMLCEVLRKFTIYSVPNTKNWFRGLVNLRGNLIPVYDISMLLGQQDVITNYENLLVLDKGADAVAILINRLPEVCAVESWQPLNDMSAIMPGLEKFIKEAYRNDDMIWSSFDHRAYFTSIKNDVVI